MNPIAYVETSVVSYLTAALRIEALRGIVTLPITPDAEILAAQLIDLQALRKLILIPWRLVIRTERRLALSGESSHIADIVQLLRKN